MKKNSYEDLFAVWLENRTSEELLKIPEDFYTEHSAMLKDLHKSRENALYDAILSSLTLRMRFLLQDILLLRLEKILSLIKENKPFNPSFLAPEEVKFLVIIKQGNLFVEDSLSAIAGKTPPMHIEGRKFIIPLA